MSCIKANKQIDVSLEGGADEKVSLLTLWLPYA